eukprot:jgi/Bigna1/92798/estExt_fgenesh1_pm.C_720008
MSEIKVHVKQFAQLLAKVVDQKSYKLTHEATPTESGKFEISVNGKVVHSKIGGKGFVDSQEKFDVVVKALIDAGAKKK